MSNKNREPTQPIMTEPVVQTPVVEEVVEVEVLNLPRINSWDSWSISLTGQVYPGYHGRTDRWRFMIN